jgi:hypothetical protein
MLAARDLVGAVPPTLRLGWIGHKDPEARAGGVAALGRAGLLERDDAERLLSDPDERPRLALAEQLAEAGPSAAWPDGSRDLLLGRLLADPSWRVRAGAIDAALASWRAAVVPLLFERLAAEDGRLRLDLADALAALTGKDLGWDADLWRAWWAQHGATFDPGPRPAARGGPLRRTAAAPPSDADETRTVSFFRLPVLSRRAAFLLDCSGSMREPLERGGAAAGTKWDLACDEVLRTVGAAGEACAFDVFLYRYPSEYPPKPFLARALGRLKQATPAAVEAARTWLAREEAKGWGAFSDAFDLLLADDEIDTVFFLSDGRPSRGRYDREERLLDELERANRFRRVVVHTVLVGTSGADRRFLQDLARRTGGRFSDANAAAR